MQLCKCPVQVCEPPALVPSNVPASTSGEVQPPLKRFKRLAQEIEAQTSSGSLSAPVSTVDDELIAYQSASKSSKSFSVQTGLDFWIKSESTFPLLAPLAENIISAPASEA